MTSYLAEYEDCFFSHPKTTVSAIHFSDPLLSDFSPDRNAKTWWMHWGHFKITPTRRLRREQEGRVECVLLRTRNTDLEGGIKVETQGIAIIGAEDSVVYFDRVRNADNNVAMRSM